jgi:hypothetical protein
MNQRPEVGSLVDEAAKLAEALQEWAGNNISDGSAACRLCPLCQMIALVRQLNPETVDQIGDQVEGLVRTLRSLLESLARQGSSSGRDSGVERIRLSEDEGDIPWE